MKIAIPTRENFVDDHFGHCEYYTIFEIEKDRLLSATKMKSPEGCGCKSNIAPLLAKMGVGLMLAGNMGEGAYNLLNSYGIKVIRGCSGEVEKVISDFINGNIADSGTGCQSHEGCNH